MFARRWLIVLIVFAVALCSPAVSYAASDASLTQVYTWEQNIDIYIAGDMNLDNLSCKVSNQEARIVESGLLADKDVTIRTTILIDISTSVPEEARGDIINYIDTLIRNIKENEEYRIVTFGRVLHFLQDFTNDRYDLANATGGIEFIGKQSKIFDAIYNTMPVTQPLEDDRPCYYRTILITDGIDETPSGITKEELYLKLQADTYPIDVIAVSKEKQETPEKDLSALVRISGGRYANLYVGADISKLQSDLATDDIYWIRGIVPGGLLDGSTRQVDISDGRNSLQFDVKFPVFDVPATPTPEATPTEEAVPTPEATPTEEAVPTPEATPTEKAIPTEETYPTQEAVSSDEPANIKPGKDPTEQENPSTEPTAVPDSEDVSDGDADGLGEEAEEADGPFGEYTLIVYISGGIGIAILLMLIIIVIVTKAKKKNQQNNTARNTYDPFADPQGEEAFSMNNAEDGLYVRLCDANNPAQTWEISLSKFAIIGRNPENQVYLNDPSVSRKQCSLYVANLVPMIENLSEVNLTQLNGEILTMPHRIKAGDKIRCGRITLLVDSFHGNDVENVNASNLNKDTDYINL